MLTRTFGQLIWNIITPSEYHLQDWPLIQTYFDGTSWVLRGNELPFGSDFPSMAVLSNALAGYATMLGEEKVCLAQ